ncbi:hypothetical protein NM688_g5999 [Phlebia brevispora]|uniref:Uncharacterized protein n=1 Tax=Phlebia brevispora TaxID=194682 RepID=A0ACC1SLJ3_9APHY|nr:hypothetical protein NM688_g5999 [Phlebia brevispora]
MLRPTRGASGRSQPDASTQAADEQSQPQTTQQRAAETRARHREEEEKSQREDAERILATGPRLSKTRAGDKIREWNAPTRKRTISQTVPEPGVEQESEDRKKPKKPRKKKDPVSNAPKNAKRESARTNLPRSLLNHNDNDNDEESEAGPLAKSVHKPTVPPTYREERRTASKTTLKGIRAQGYHQAPDRSDDDPELQGWLSDEEPHVNRGGSDDDENDDDDGDSYKPSEESDDTGHIDKKLEVPRWINNSRRGRADNDADDIDTLIPDVIDYRSRRSSTGSAYQTTRAISIAAHLLQNTMKMTIGLMPLAYCSPGLHTTAIKDRELTPRADRRYQPTG